MDNFYKTAIRTSTSSKKLNDNKDYFNSCYLGGYTLECYSKILLQLVYGLSESELKTYIGHNIKKAIKEINFLKTTPNLNGLINTMYLLDIKNDCPFMTKSYSKWNPIKRYSDDETFWNETVSKEYQNEIIIIRQKLAIMKLDGVI